MGRYLDSLNEKFDEITKGGEEILDRAADEGRELTKEEQELVDRAADEAETLKKSIEHYSAQEVTRAKVAELRGKVPSTSQRTSTTVVVEREKDPDKELVRLFPTAGDYVVAVGRALRGDRDAAQLIERATAHQTTTENPGLLPRPILGPVIDLITGNRRFIQSITTRPLPAQKFDRPKVTQQVQVGIQPAQKQLTASRQLLIDNLPVEAPTFAGHLNIARQNIKWSTPSLMQLIIESFATQYSLETEDYAAEQFAASVAELTPLEVDTWDGARIRRLLFQAAATPLDARKELGFPDTFWMSTDVWVELGSLMTPLGIPYFPSLEPGNPGGGNVGGFTPVVVPRPPAGSGVIGRGSLAEWYEDLDGLIQVAEPDVLGQLVGYSGEGAFLNTAPEVFSLVQFPPVPEGALEEASAAALEAPPAEPKKPAAKSAE